VGQRTPLVGQRTMPVRTGPVTRQVHLARGGDRWPVAIQVETTQTSRVSSTTLASSGKDERFARAAQPSGGFSYV
jgi:hypothetical protein